MTPAEKNALLLAKYGMKPNTAPQQVVTLPVVVKQVSPVASTIDEFISDTQNTFEEKSKTLYTTPIPVQPAEIQVPAKRRGRPPKAVSNEPVISTKKSKGFGGNITEEEFVDFLRMTFDPNKRKPKTKYLVAMFNSMDDCNNFIKITGSGEYNVIGFSHTVRIPYEENSNFVNQAKSYGCISYHTHTI